jgi:hypothetical protein
MVKTGARAIALQALLTRIGRSPSATKPAGPRLSILPDVPRDWILDLYRELGGRAESPTLRPGGWDLVCAGDIVVELDEELHFNRYRRLTLLPEWAAALPWRDDYGAFCSEQEPACLAAATWGRRWTNPSSEVLFGVADAAGDLGSSGAPRWKQRALYDAMKDASTLFADSFRLIRLATHDLVGGTRLGDALEGRATLDLDALAAMLTSRSTLDVRREEDVPASP